MPKTLQTMRGQLVLQRLPRDHWGKRSLLLPSLDSTTQAAMKTISAAEAAALPNGTVFLHVLPEEHFACGHLPTALNACVYETAFLDKVANAVPDKSVPVVVYGAGGASLDSAVAAEKLAGAGYTNVMDLRGGLPEWVSQGLSIEGDGNPTSEVSPEGKFSVDTETSVVRWTGRNLFNHHRGTLKLSHGSLEISNGNLKSAVFGLAMESIACEDLADSAMNAMLIRHLKHDDFFAVDRYPNAEFVCEKVAPLPDSTPGQPNYTLQGSLTLRGVTKPLSFPAVIAAADADHVIGQAQFEFDRTQFGAIYGSGRLFAFLGKHVVNDMVHVHIVLHARRA